MENNFTVDGKLRSQLPEKGDLVFVYSTEAGDNKSEK